MSLWLKNIFKEISFNKFHKLQSGERFKSTFANEFQISKTLAALNENWRAFEQKFLRHWTAEFKFSFHQTSLRERIQ